MDATAITHRFVDVHGLRIHLAEAGPVDGPVVLLLHGFPECWYSWRHQLPALAAAGFRAVAPDQRGYARSDAPEAIEDYTILHLVGDAIGVLDAIGADRAVVVGHDWGAPGVAVPGVALGPLRGKPPAAAGGRTERQLHGCDARTGRAAELAQRGRPGHVRRGVPRARLHRRAQLVPQPRPQPGAHRRMARDP